MRTNRLVTLVLILITLPAALGIAYVRAQEPPPEVAWDGGSTATANWSDGANWVGDAVPPDGATRVFPAGAAQPANVHDLGSRSGAIRFDGGGYTVTATAGSTFTPSSITSTVDLVTNDVAIPLVLDGDLETTVDFGSAVLILSGPITGTGDLVLTGGADGGGYLTLTADNTFTGEVRLQDTFALLSVNGNQPTIPITSQSTTDQSGYINVNGTSGPVALWGPTAGALGGVGTVMGDVTIHVGYLTGADAFAFGPIGTLTIQGHLDMGGAVGGLAADLASDGTGDQINVAGNVTVGGSLTPRGDGGASSYTLIANDGDDAVAGTFLDLNEGATLEVNGLTYAISYAGGDGNDVVITKEGGAFTWDGGGDTPNWSEAANWVGDLQPPSGSALVFPAAIADQATTHDLDDGFEASLRFEAGGYSISGTDTLRLLGLVGGDETITSPLDVGDDDTVVSVSGGGTLSLQGDIAGGGELRVTGIASAGFVELTGPASTFDGTISLAVGQGQLVIVSDLPDVDVIVEDGYLEVDGRVAAVSALAAGDGIAGADAVGGAGTIQGALDVDGGYLTAGDPYESDISTLTSAGGLELAVDLFPDLDFTGADLIAVTGPVVLDATARLMPSAGEAPPFGTVLVDNDGDDPVQGTFTDLPEGATLDIAGTTYATTYVGGDGNDIVLLEPPPTKDATTTSVESSPNPSVFGESVTITVTVTGGESVPTGEVDISEANSITPLGTIALVDGAGSLTTNELMTGLITIGAHYDGDDTHESSESLVDHTVNQAATATAIVADTPDPSTVSQSYTVSVTVSAVAPGAGTPTGTVGVSDGDGASCTVDALSGGSGSCQLASTSPGDKTLTATYEGGTNFLGSTSAGEAHGVSGGVVPFTWDGDAGPDDRSWHTAANWSSDVVPGASDDAVVPAGFDTTTGPQVAAASATVASLVLASPLELGSGRTLTLGSGSSSSSAGVSGSGTLVNEGTLSLLAGAGWSGPMLLNPGTLVGAGASATETFGPLVNSGAVRADLSFGVGPVSGIGNYTTTDDGTLSFRGDGGVLPPGSSLSGTGRVFLDGSLTAADDTIDIDESLVVHGTLALAGDAAVAVEITVRGTLSLDGTAISGSVRAQGGLVEGSGSVNSSLISDGGRVDPEGTLSVDSYDSASINDAPAVLAIEASSASVFDRLAVTGGASLHSSHVLEVTLVGGYAPDPADVLRFLDAVSGLSGTFGTVSGAVPFTVDYDATGAELIIPATPKDDTVTSLGTDPNPSTVGETVVFTGTVSSGSATPTGSVTFSDADNPLGVATLDDNGVAVLSTDGLSAGTHTITAVYSGDDTHNGSAGAVTQTVADPGNVDTTASITSDDPDPSVVGRGYTVGISVAPVAGDGTPTGGVEVSDGSAMCLVALSGGNGSCVLTSTTAGPKTLTATYLGDEDFNGSTVTGVAHTVNNADSEFAVVLSPTSPTVVGQSYQVGATIAPVPSGTVVPTGTVTVSDGTGASCQGTLTEGVASCQLTSTSAGAKTLTYTYGGDANFNGNTTTAPHVVDEAATTLTFESDSPDPSVVGETVTAVFTVAVGTPGAGTPTGSVTVSDGVDSCTAAVAAGQCEILLTTVGTRTLDAVYSGDDNFLGSDDDRTHSVEPGLALSGDTGIVATPGQPFSDDVGSRASGGVPPYTFAVTSGSLPVGLTLSGSTITGTPTTAGAYPFVLTVTDSGDRTASADYKITVTDGLSLPAAAPDGEVSVPYSVSLAAAGGTPPYSHLVSGNLPPGLTFDPASAQLSGTPTAAGTFTFTVMVTDSTSGTASREYVVTIVPAPSLAPSLPGGQVGVAYSGSVAGAGGTAPFTYAVTAGTLPSGLALVGATGAVTGTPSALGTFTFTVGVTDALGATASQAYTVVVTGGDLAISPPSIGPAEEGIDFTVTFGASGAFGAVSWSVSSGSLPAGLLLSSGGVLSGEPADGSAGSYTFVVRAVDSSGQSGELSYTWVVAAPPVLPESVPGGTAGDLYSSSVAVVSGGVSPVVYELVDGSLPDGLALDTGNGMLAGSLDHVGTFTFSIEATDSLGGAATQEYTIEVAEAEVSVGPSELGSAEEGIAYSQTITANGFVGAPSFAVTDGSLPPGLSLARSAGQQVQALTDGESAIGAQALAPAAASTATLSGTPTTPGTYAFTITVTDPAGNDAQLAGRIVVAPRLTLSAGELPAGTSGQPYSSSVPITGGVAPVTFAVSGGALPPGVTLAADGTLMGTPTQPGQYTVEVTATDAVGAAATRSISFTVNAAAGIPPSGGGGGGAGSGGGGGSGGGAAGSDSLSQTGIELLSWLGAALALILVGSSLLRLSRRRTR